MYSALGVIVILGGAAMAFIGAYGLFTYTEATTSELQEDQMWISIALLAGGLGLLAQGLMRYVPRITRE